MLYYNIELASKSAHLLVDELNSIGNILCGDMCEVLNIVEEGYKKRTGVDMPDDVEDIVVRNLATVQLIGWGTAIGEKYTKKHVNENADALFDISNVLSIQMNHSEDGKDLYNPEKMSDEYELPRFLKIVTSDCNRRSQLRIFRDDI